MNVLLVNPLFPPSYWSFHHALAFEGKRSAFPPLGLLTVSSLLPDSWERRLVDLNVCDLDDADIAWADVVFATAMIVQRESLDEVVARSKALGKRVAVGGPYVSTCDGNLPDADHIFSGEAETTLPEFVADLERGNPKPYYKAAEMPPMSLAPAPDFGLADLKRYSAMSIQYSRGCPFNCEFCDIIEIYGRVPRTKSPAQVLGELDALHDAGWRGSVFIVDDNFIGNKRDVKLLLPELAAWQERNGHPFEFITEASVNLADDDVLLKGMQRAGFQRVFLGIETPVEETLIHTQKKQNTRSCLTESVRKIQGHGMEVMGGFIVGFDTDPEDIFDRQVEFIRESAIPLAMVGLLNALPGTQLWRRLQTAGRLLSMSTGDNTSCSLNFVPKMDPARLIEGYKKVLRSIYNSHDYYQRALDSLSRVATVEMPRHRSIAGGIAAFARIAYRLGVADADRVEFWRYFARVITRHRARFSEALTLAAMGYHFRKLTESVTA